LCDAAILFSYNDIKNVGKKTMKPVILLTAGTKEPDKLPKSVVLTDYYMEYIRKGGGIPIITCDERKDELKRLLKISNGLLLTGGGDPNPDYFMEKDENPGYEYDEKRDAMEYELIRLFMEAEKPVMGICRGIQMINIVCGGTLHQDIYKKLNVDHPQDKEHYVYTKKGSWWNNNCGDRFKVNSYHHQALNIIGKDLLPVVFDEESHIIEAIEHKYLPVYGVQWHPERMNNMYKFVERFLIDVDNKLAFHNRFV